LYAASLELGTPKPPFSKGGLVGLSISKWGIYPPSSNQTKKAVNLTAFVSFVGAEGFEVRSTRAITIENKTPLIAQPPSWFRTRFVDT